MAISRVRLEELLDSWKGKRVLVVGDVGVDRYTIGAVERISPEAPVPIVRVEEERLKLGLAANVADNVKALGAIPWMAGVVGRDRAADDFFTLMDLADISSHYIVKDNASRTVLKERIVSESQQLLRVDYESPSSISAKAKSQLIKKIRAAVKRCDVVILEDYAKGLMDPKLSREVYSACTQAGRIVATDPNTRTPLSFYRGATLLTPNTREAEALVGFRITDTKSLKRAGVELLKKTGARFAVITRGRDGMALFTRGEGGVKVIPTYAREVYDVSGAGDTVIAVMALALAVGANLEEAAILANLAAGVEVGKRGTATVSPKEIVGALDLFGLDLTPRLI